MVYHHIVILINAFIWWVWRTVFKSSFFMTNTFIGCVLVLQNKWFGHIAPKKYPCFYNHILLFPFWMSNAYLFHNYWWFFLFVFGSVLIRWFFVSYRHIMLMEELTGRVFLLRKAHICQTEGCFGQLQQCFLSIFFFSSFSLLTMLSFMNSYKQSVVPTCLLLLFCKYFQQIFILYRYPSLLRFVYKDNNKYSPLYASNADFLFVSLVGECICSSLHHPEMETKTIS